MSVLDPVLPALLAHVQKQPLAEQPARLSQDEAHRFRCLLQPLLTQPGLSDKQKVAASLELLGGFGTYTVRMRVTKWAANLSDVHQPGDEVAVDRTTLETWLRAGEAVPVDPPGQAHAESLGYVGIVMQLESRSSRGVFAPGELVWLPVNEARRLVERSYALPLHSALPTPGGVDDA